MAINTEISPVLQTLSKLTYDEKNIASALEYSAALDGLSNAHKRLVMSISGLTDAQQAEILAIDKAALAVNGLTLSELSAKTGIDAETLAKELNLSATDSLTTAKLKEALVSGTLTEETLKSILAIQSETAAMTAQVAVTKTLGTALKETALAMVTNPLTLIPLVITAISGLIKLVDLLVVSYDEAAEKADNSRQAYESALNEIESLNGELETTQKRIDELNAKASLTLVEQEELINLQSANDLLLEQLEIEKTIAQYRKEQALNDAKNALNNKGFTVFNDGSGGKNSFLTFMARWGLMQAGEIDASRYVDIVDYVSAKQERVNELTEQRTALIREQAETIERGSASHFQLDDYTRRIENLDTQIIESKGEVAEYLETIQGYRNTLVDSVTGDAYAGFEDEVRRIDELNALILESRDKISQEARAEQEQIDAFLSRSDLKSSIDAVKQKATELNGISLADFESQFPNLAQAAKDAGLDVQNIVNSINSSIESVNGNGGISSYTAELSDLSETLSNLQDAYDLVASAEKDMADGGGLSPDTIEKIASAEKNYLNYLYEENGVVKLNTEAWKENANAKMLGEINEIQREIGSLEERNKVLRETITLLQEQAKTGPSDNWFQLDITRQIAEASREFDANTKVIAENQGKLAIYSSLYGSITGDLTNATTNLVDALEKLDIASSNISSISKAMGEFADDGIVSVDTLNGMAKELKNLSGFNDFANTLSNSASSMDEVQEACNRLAEEYITTTKILDDVNEETAQVIEGHLSEMGVINAHEIVQARLNAVKWEAVLSEQNLQNAAWDTVEAFLTESGAADATIQALQQLRTAQYNAELANTDFSKASQITISDLLTQAKAAGVATEYVNALSKALAFKKRFEDGKASSYELNHYEEILEGYKKQAEANIADINVVVPRVTVTRPKPGSGSKKAQKEVEEYLATIDRFREAQEQLRRVEEKRKKIENRIENSGSLEERIRLRKELIEAYKDEQVALHELNKQRDAAIKEDVDKLTDLGFEVEFDPDNNQFWVKNLEHINDLTAKSKGKYETLQEATNALRKDTESLISTLDELNGKNREGSAEWLEDEKAKIEAIIANYEDITKAYENEISMREKWLSNAAEKKDTAAVEQNTREIVGYYQKMQQNIHGEAEYYRSLGYSEDSDEVTTLKTLWWDYADNIKEAKNGVIDYLTDIVEASNSAVDEIENVYDTFRKAADEYAQSGGYITIDTYQEILELGPQYLQLLMDENGALVLEEEAIQNVIAARVEQLALENAMAYVERLRLAATGESMESLNDLLYVTDLTTDATWGLVKAKLALMKAKGELNIEQYEAALHNIEAMETMTVNAVNGIYKSIEGAGDLMQYVMDMMKSNIEQEIDGIKRMKDEFAELIDLRKKSLDAAKDEAGYQKDVAAKTKEMAKLQARIDAISMDDSRKAQAERAKLLEEMNNLQEDLNKKQSDHAIDQQKEALDKMQKDYEETQDARIKDLEDSISSEQKLYDMAVKHIKSNWGSLLDELTEWNYQFGSDLTVEIEGAWDKAIKAAQNYFDYVSGNDVMGKDYVKYYESTNQGGSGGSGGSGNNKNYIVADTRKTQDYSDLDMVHAIVARMKEYAAAWKPGDPTGEHSKAADEAARLPQYGVKADFNNASGIWTITEDRLDPRNKGKNLYSVYHTGGVVGSGGIKANEEIALLKDKEWVLSEEMVENLSKQMKRLNTLSEAFTESTQYERTSILPELVKTSSGSTVNNVTNNNRPVEIKIGDTVIQGKASAETVAAHQKVTRGMVNEIVRIIGVRL